MSSIENVYLGPAMSSGSYIYMIFSVFNGFLCAGRFLSTVENDCRGAGTGVNILNLFD